MMPIKTKIAGDEINKKIKKYLGESVKDAKILRSINIDYIKKEMPQLPDEEIRDYFSRIQGLERNPEYLNPIFPTSLVDWVESLADNHFPRDGRKRFAKWLGNAVYQEEKEINGDGHNSFHNLNIYNNDVRYIVDYLNGAQDVPNNIWNLKFREVFDLSEAWHETFKDTEDPGKIYNTKIVVYKFSNGFSIVSVPPEDLAIEGDKMQHCVGGYCDSVSQGSMSIYSLRSPKNKPHATIDVSRGGRIEQIKGRQNAPPEEKYRPMIEEWLATTDFDYKNSIDYIVMQPVEKIMSLIEAGEINDEVLGEVLYNDSSLKIVNTLLDPDRNPAKLGEGALFGIASNKNITESHAKTILGLELLYGKLGQRIKSVFDSAYTSPQRDLEEFIQLAWEWSNRYGLKQNSYWIVTWCVRMTRNKQLIKEIVEKMFSEEVLKSFESEEGADKPGGFLYRWAIQKYLDETTGHSLELVKKIFAATRKGTEFNKWVYAGGTDQVDSYIAASDALSEDLIDYLIKNDESAYYSDGNARTLLKNPAVPDKFKFGIVQMIIKNRGEAALRVFGHNFFNELDKDDKKIKSYSKKLLLYILNSGLFDKGLDDKTRRQFYVKYGRAGGGPEDGRFQSALKKNIEDFIEKINRVHTKKSYLDEGRYTMETKENKVDEELQKYMKLKENPHLNEEDLEDLKVMESWLNEIIQETTNDD